MSRRRPSLMEILAEEREDAPLSPQEPTPSSSEHTSDTSEGKSESKSESKSVSKSDYIRLSVTLPPDVFERLQTLSLSRRKAREPYTFCHLARQAIVEWLDRQEQT